MILMDRIVREGHPALRKRAEEVKFPLSEENIKLCEELLEYVKNSQDSGDERKIRTPSRNRTRGSTSE